MKTTYEAAVYYIEQLKLFLVPIPHGQKGLDTPGWNKTENSIHTIDGAEHWKIHPNDNMGLLHGPSGTMAFDVDSVDKTKLVLSMFNLDYDALLKGAPRIIGSSGHDKAIFRMPLGLNLSTKKLSWESEKDPKTRDVLFELRGGPVQDVLPPSIHPDTHKPYEWRIENEVSEIPLIPDALLTIWKEWDSFGPQLINACPWATKKITPPKKKDPNKQPIADEDNIIEKYNRATPIDHLIEKYGYRKMPGGKYLSPFSKKGIAGVVIFKDENKLYSHHASEPFDTSRAHDAFDMFCHFEHNGNIIEALKDAANQLGVKTRYEKEIEHGKNIFQEMHIESKKEKIKKINKFQNYETPILPQITSITEEELEKIKKSLCNDIPPFPIITHPLFKKWMDVGGRLMYSHKSYHFGNLLAIASMALGRRVSVLISTKHTYANCNVMLVGTSTISGKSFSSDTAIDEYGKYVCAIPTLLNPIDNTELKRKSVSNPRLIQDMSKTNNVLWYYDEAKEFFDDCGDRGWNTPIIGTLCTAYDGGVLEKSLSNANSKKDDVDRKWICDNPFLSLLFNMTITQLKEASTPKILSSGFLFRWMWFVENGGEKKRNISASDVDIKEITEIRNEICKVGSELKKLKMNDICFVVNDKIEQWSLDISKKSDDENFQSATGRGVIHIYKIAMIFTLFDPECQKTIFNQSKYPIKLNLPDKWVDEAINIVENYLLPRMLKVVEYSDKVDSNNKQQRVLNDLKSVGGVELHSKLLNKTKLDAGDFRKAISTLVESEQIEYTKMNNKPAYKLKI